MPSNLNSFIKKKKTNKKKKLFPTDRPYFFQHVTVNKHFFLALAILPYFNAISIDFYVVMCV